MLLAGDLLFVEVLLAGVPVKMTVICYLSKEAMVLQKDQGLHGNF